ncbi:8-amino-7-oxononanoate synthase [Chryseobacterium shandongense]|uniref:8-amino-7-oxononanoate synthase n=1 Tax=Chryseobacterium shandongense TaxID=1493872 RepID=A0AAD0YFY7_9FLAO|nr:8-amino-7-oxononanoate synthase [Chryseobacterium shandongense]AZA88199.1 8-amino-7-oxononanoate synthase [Chryseobacterium shandongense]
MSYHLKIYNSDIGFPENWTSTVGKYNVMLSEEYFRALHVSLPSNMECFMVGIFKENELVGGALFQYIDFVGFKKSTKNEPGWNLKSFFSGILIKDVMILGNNMLTGQNGFYFDFSKVSVEDRLMLLHKAVDKMQREIRKTSLIIFKDYQKDFAEQFTGKKYKSYFRFSVQPNMKLKIRESWKTFDEYVNDFSKKYRTRVKSAKKKLNGIEKLELNLESVKKYQKEMNCLYHNVADNASFNTFFLAENHFEKMKENLKDKFKVFGYFSDKELVGFYTLIINNNDIDTYFLGYHKEIQKEKQIYLNMLLDMVGYGILYQFKTIVFGRTALEIKSTIGAEPTEIFGLIKHTNFMINPFMNILFPFISPKTDWIQRRPFK